MELGDGWTFPQSGYFFKDIDFSFDCVVKILTGFAVLWGCGSWFDSVGFHSCVDDTKACLDDRTGEKGDEFPRRHVLES